MRILIFGGSGFIGAELSKYLTLHKAEVVIFARSPPKNNNYSEFVKWSFDSKLTQELIKDADAAIHLANDTKDLKKTYYGTLACISELRKHGVKYQMFMSSYSASKEALSEYGQLKYKIEKKLSADITIIRPGLVIGSGGIYQKIKKTLLNNLFYPIFITEYEVPVIAIGKLCKEIYSIIQNKKKPSEVNIFEHKFIRLNQLIFNIVKNKKNKIGIYLPIILTLIVIKLNEFFKNGISLDNFRGLILNQRVKKISAFKPIRSCKENQADNNQITKKTYILEYLINGFFFSLLASCFQALMCYLFIDSKINLFVYSAAIIYILLTIINYQIQKFWIFYQKPSDESFYVFIIVNIISLWLIIYINKALILFEFREDIKFISLNFNYFLSLIFVAPVTFLLQSLWTFAPTSRR